MPWDITEDFEYVVVQQEAPQICFGSTLEKETLPISGPNLSSFMRRIVGENSPNLGPGSHVDGRDAFHDVTHRKYGKYGLGPRAPRFIVKHEYQPPWREPPKPGPWPQNCAPFNSTAKRKSIFKSNDNPSPCDTSPVYKKKQIKFAYSFQGKKSLICPVVMKCVPYNLDQCGACGCFCSAEGDYWAFENRIFLCRRHYNKFFKHCLSKFQGAKLADFKPIRDCFFAHAHNSCKAAVKIMSKEDITKKLRKEAYLDLFFPMRRFCDI
ncbi:uncharacterized protein LOC113231214 [Hyposmocoma kahamanoa]|uniref:uncharacterized protein LOC113231214 n=1 Tax=Hyposmocoma kahamanoa TaxID=1477025 RepID=UPI000E6D6FF7|nr:uncharacterized protein LOC113231214 [Hyposmocoma kahamanoa]